ncbi:hypothetical protein [Devosia insulae]|uniref:hypothetical protein n=1 Tax=Devosia insulae TaxID=408174 RepID=UPI00159F29E3|nr:hypothetical protein [Devosia insulae]
MMRQAFILETDDVPHMPAVVDDGGTPPAALDYQMPLARPLPANLLTQAVSVL